RGRRPSDLGARCSFTQAGCVTSSTDCGSKNSATCTSALSIRTADPSTRARRHRSTFNPIRSSSSLVRVLHVTPYFAPAFRYGGPPRSILGLCRALGDAGVDIEVFTTTANGDQPLASAPQGVVYDGIRVRYFPLAWPQRYWNADGLRTALRTAATDADVVHVHGLWNMTSWAGVATARAAGKPHVLSPRGMLQPEAMRRHRELKTPAYRGVERRNLKSAALLH